MGKFRTTGTSKSVNSRKLGKFETGKLVYIKDSELVRIFKLETER